MSSIHRASSEGMRLPQRRRGRAAASLAAATLLLAGTAQAFVVTPPRPLMPITTTTTTTTLQRRSALPAGFGPRSSSTSLSGLPLRRRTALLQTSEALSTQATTTAATTAPAPITPPSTMLHSTWEATKGVLPFLSLGALITYWGQTTIGPMNDPMLARITWSAAVSVLGSFIAPAMAPAIACGSYLGMCSQTVIPSLGWMAVASVIASVVYALEVRHIKAAENMGGRLGTVALFGAVLTFLVKSVGCGQTRLQLPSLLLAQPFYHPHNAVLEMMASGFAAAATIFARQRIMLLSSPARAAGFIGLLGSLLLPLWVEGVNLSVAVYGGGFVGMTDPKIFGKQPGVSRLRRIVRSYAMAGALGAGANAFLHCFLVGGWGGKLGMTALLGVVGLKTLRYR